MELWNAPPPLPSPYLRFIYQPDQLLKAIREVCSHDLRSSLSTIDLISQLLEDAPLKIKEQAARIRHQTAKGLLISDTLMYSCLAAEQSLTPEWGFFNPAEPLKHALKKNDYPISSQLPETLSCWGDPQLITIALEQLISSLFANGATKLKFLLKTHFKNSLGLSWEIEAQGPYFQPQSLTLPLTFPLDPSPPKNSRTLQFLLAHQLFNLQHGTISHSIPAPSTPAPSTPAPSTPAPSTPAPSTPAPSNPSIVLQLWMPFAAPKNKWQQSIEKLKPWQKLPCAILSSDPQRAKIAAHCLMAAGFKQLSTQPHQPPASLLLDALHPPPPSSLPNWIKPPPIHGPWLLDFQSLTPFSLLELMAESISP